MKSPARSENLLVLQRERCQGCTHCIRVCPTEAIRIRRGKADVMYPRCVQCGGCIKACPRAAWKVQADSLARIKEKGNALAVLDPAVFWQFGGQVPPWKVAEAFLTLGFTDVRDLSEPLRIYGLAVAKYLASAERRFPAIASACPAVVQFVRVKYPSLLEHLVPIIPPGEIAAFQLKDLSPANSSMRSYYIAPCLAQAVAAIEPLSKKWRFHGAVPVADVFNAVRATVGRKEPAPDGSPEKKSDFFGLEWATAGGESRILGMEPSLVVDGIHHVAKVLDLAESGRLTDVPFIEAWACAGGCVGGPLTVEDPFVARYHMASWTGKQKGRKKKGGIGELSIDIDRLRLDGPLSPRPGMRLDEDLKVAMAKLRRIDEVVKKFPGIDCGSCGCPNCLALAEDVVQGFARESDCLYVLKDKRANRPKGM